MESYYRGGGCAAFWRVPEPAFKLKSTPDLKFLSRNRVPIVTQIRPESKLKFTPNLGFRAGLTSWTQIQPEVKPKFATDFSFSELELGTGKDSNPPRIQNQIHAGFEIMRWN